MGDKNTRVNTVEPDVVPIEAIQGDSLIRSVFNAKRFPHVLQNFKKHNIILPVLVTPHETEEGKYDLIQGDDDLAVQREAGIKMVSVSITVTKLNYHERIEMLFTRNLSQILSASYTSKYLMIEFLEKYFKDSPTVNWGFPVSRETVERIAQVLGCHKNTVKNIRRVGRHDADHPDPKKRLALLQRIDAENLSDKSEAERFGFYDALEQVDKEEKERKAKAAVQQARKDTPKPATASVKKNGKPDYDDKAGKAYKEPQGRKRDKERAEENKRKEEERKGFLAAQRWSVDVNMPHYNDDTKEITFNKITISLDAAGYPVISADGEMLTGDGIETSARIGGNAQGDRFIKYNVSFTDFTWEFILTHPLPYIREKEVIKEVERQLTVTIGKHPQQPAEEPKDLSWARKNNVTEAGLDEEQPEEQEHT